MTDRHSIRLTGPAAFAKARRGLDMLAGRLGEGWTLILTRKRSSVQNALMWARLAEISKQLEWHGKHWTAEQWKDCLMHAWKGGEFMPGVDGGFVPIGRSTSSLGVREMSDFLDLLEAFAGQHDVNLKEAQDRAA
ncbi:recombination protein NinB [uncultured Maricaulis sp.]|jgi:NinB protein|uniref:recombination protein NinB n=1 Tax=uncultured Maricaulis sp. TaxID=174710 RepID=UPI0030D989A3